jgi:hypothetical protein
MFVLPCDRWRLLLPPILSPMAFMGNVDFLHFVKPRICSFAERDNVIREDNLKDVFSPEEGSGK